MAARPGSRLPGVRDHAAEQAARKRGRPPKPAAAPAADDGELHASPTAKRQRAKSAPPGVIDCDLEEDSLKPRQGQAAAAGGGGNNAGAGPAGGEKSNELWRTLYRMHRPHVVGNPLKITDALGISKQEQIEETLVQRLGGMDPTGRLRTAREVASKGPKRVGLRNLSNTCYLNAAMQALHSHPGICQVFYELPHQAGPGASEQDQLAASVADPLQRLFATMHDGRLTWADPEPLVRALLIQPAIQQDAEEFWNSLVQFLAPEPAHPMQQLLGGQSILHKTCDVCKRQKEGRIDDFCGLRLVLHTHEPPPEDAAAAAAAEKGEVKPEGKRGKKEPKSERESGKEKADTQKGKKGKGETNGEKEGEQDGEAEKEEGDAVEGATDAEGSKENGKKKKQKLRYFSSLIDAIDNYYSEAGRMMDATNKVMCERCRKNQLMHEKARIQRLPEILPILTPRVVHTEEGNKKMRHNVAVPYELDFARWFYAQADKETRYRLTARVEHHGTAPTCGHYTAVVWDPEEKSWIRFNDREAEVDTGLPGGRKPTAKQQREAAQIMDPREGVVVQDGVMFFYTRVDHVPPEVQVPDRLKQSAQQVVEQVEREAREYDDKKEDVNKLITLAWKARKGQAASVKAAGDPFPGNDRWVMLPRRWVHAAGGAHFAAKPAPDGVSVRLPAHCATQKDIDTADERDAVRRAAAQRAADAKAAAADAADAAKGEVASAAAEPPAAPEQPAAPRGTGDAEAAPKETAASGADEPKGKKRQRGGKDPAEQSPSASEPRPSEGAPKQCGRGSGTEEEAGRKRGGSKGQKEASGALGTPEGAAAGRQGQMCISPKCAHNGRKESTGSKEAAETHEGAGEAKGSKCAKKGKEQRGAKGSSRADPVDLDASEAETEAAPKGSPAKGRTAPGQEWGAGAQAAADAEAAQRAQDEELARRLSREDTQGCDAEKDRELALQLQGGEPDIEADRRLAEQLQEEGSCYGQSEKTQECWVPRLPQHPDNWLGLTCPHATVDGPTLDPAKWKSYCCVPTETAKTLCGAAALSEEETALALADGALERRLCSQCKRGHEVQRDMETSVQAWMSDLATKLEEAAQDDITADHVYINPDWYREFRRKNPSVERLRSIGMFTDMVCDTHGAGEAGSRLAPGARHYVPVQWAEDAQQAIGEELPRELWPLCQLNVCKECEEEEARDRAKSKVLGTQRKNLKAAHKWLGHLLRGYGEHLVHTLWADWAKTAEVRKKKRLKNKQGAGGDADGVNLGEFKVVPHSWALKLARWVLDPSEDEQLQDPPVLTSEEVDCLLTDQDSRTTFNLSDWDYDAAHDPADPFVVFVEDAGSLCDENVMDRAAAARLPTLRVDANCNITIDPPPGELAETRSQEFKERLKNWDKSDLSVRGEVTDDSMMAREFKERTVTMHSGATIYSLMLNVMTEVGGSVNQMKIYFQDRELTAPLDELHSTSLAQAGLPRGAHVRVEVCEPREIPEFMSTIGSSSGGGAKPGHRKERPAFERTIFGSAGKADAIKAKAAAAAGAAEPARKRKREDGDGDEVPWACGICTLENAAGTLACSACQTPRPE
eukprot:TRINITY_DN9424_c0_g1_i5.p1 TRINITY_DN9424_c0_g1~~TRINITY_DN9424_c0_g1_i5.p1  ORF type:complete len:1629 (+),score=508.51 TRINITY_DN9424_c0_g1_i5:176-4888(+)